MKSISPIIATVILLLMTVAAGGMAYITITSFQSQAQTGGEGAVQQMVAQTQSQLKIESVKDGKIYVRNLGSGSVEKVSILVDGKPVEFTGPETCEPKETCVFRITEALDCISDMCTVEVTSRYGGIALRVNKEQIEPKGPTYSNWTLNTTGILFGGYILANVTWESGQPSCPLVGGCYWFSNQGFVTQEVGEFEWG